MSLIIDPQYRDFPVEEVVAQLERVSLTEKKGDLWTAECIRLELVKAAHSIDDVGRRSLALAHIVAACLQRGDLRGARGVLFLIPDSRDKEAFSLIGRKVEEISDIQTRTQASRMVSIAQSVIVSETPIAPVIRALKTAEIVETEDGNRALASSITQQAFRMAWSLKDEKLRSLALANVALLYLKKGNYADAKNSISLIPDFYSRGEAYPFILKEVNSFLDDQAKTAASHMLSAIVNEAEEERLTKERMTFVFSELQRAAKAEKEDGNRKRALFIEAQTFKIGQSIQNAGMRSWALAHVAVAYLMKGDFDEARKVVSMIPSLDGQTESLSIMRRNVEQISDRDMRDEALSVISAPLHALVEESLKIGNKESIDRAAKIALLIPDSRVGTQYVVLAEIVKHYVRMGTVDNALKFVEDGVPTGSDKGGLVLEIIKEYLQQEDKARIDKALLIALSSPYYDKRTETLVYVLRKYARIGMGDYARGLILDLFSNDKDKSYAFQAIVDERDNK